jgi:cation/acetate symporter
MAEGRSEPAERRRRQRRRHRAARRDRIGGDIIVLATPEIAGLPYVISGMVAAGGLAAALSTADGLLLTIANALSHDLYYKMIDPNAPTARRVMISKILLLVVAVARRGGLAETGRHPVPGLGGVLAGGRGFFPALVLGIFWKRATVGRVAGHGAGVAITFYYMATHPALAAPGVRRATSIETAPGGASRRSRPASSACRSGFLVIILVSLVTPPPSREIQEFVEHVRYPGGSGV